MKRLLVIIVFLAGFTAMAQKNGAIELKIKTSAQCDMCKERIEKAMAYEKGVKKSNLDLETKVLTVSYLPGKTTPEKIRKALAAVGYDADDVPADPKAYAALPPCCKKPDDPDHVGH
jgi:cation transport ATPase